MFFKRKPRAAKIFDETPLTDDKSMELHLLLHTYKTPLSVIIGYTELLISDMVSDEAQRKEMLLKILEKAKHLSSLTNSLNIKMRTDIGLGNTYKKETDIVTLAKKTVDNMMVVAMSNNVKIHINALAPIKIKLDEVKIATVFEELLTNAIKHMDQSGNISIVISEVEDTVLIVFKNDGKGIDESECARIFECGYKSNSDGNGLGLFAVKTIVEAHGGTVYVKSTPDTGFGVYINLPRNYSLTDF